MRAGRDRDDFARRARGQASPINDFPRELAARGVYVVAARLACRRYDSSAEQPIGEGANTCRR